MKSVVTIAALTLAGATARANPPAAVLDAGGGRSSNGNVTHDGSLGGIGGIATHSPTTAKHGYTGQLYDPAALQITATPPTVPENGTRQLSAALVMDDATTLATGGIVWSITAGPITINSSGLASGQPVYQDTAATVQASAGSVIGTLDLTVLNVLADNFGTYAGDGIADGWQVQHFGLDNPDAGPGSDADDDGFDNLFEYHACLVPVDPFSRFYLRMEEVSGQPDARRIVFSPANAECTYTLESSATLAPASWSPVPGAILATGGSEWSLTDPDSSADRLFYRIAVQRP